ncbi:MAG TPA: ABC transporter permease [Gemmatimonadaceae bacterium]|jgi:putative ABC transport system permease protein|nr:ABC transporter permease [Gemmatimonadaceae bacterium]
MRAVEHVFGLILRLYPSGFRRQYGDEMRSFVQARLGEPRYASPWGALGLVCHLLVDGIAGAVREHLVAFAASPSTTGAIPGRRAPVSHNEPPEELMATLVHDARYAVRTLRRRPAFTIVAAITLALGIGATSAIFGVIDTMLFRPLRYPAPDQIVVVSMMRGGSLREPPAYPDFLDWREQSRSFQSLGVTRSQSLNLTGRETPERLSGNFVSASLLRLLGAEPLAGRLFTFAETEVGTAAPVAVISEGLWRRRFGAEPTIVGSTIVLNGQQFTVVGIVPSTFAFFGGTDVYLPITYYPNNAGLTRKDHSMFVVGRLRPDVTLASADAEMRAIGARLAEQFPSENAGSAAHVESLHTLLVGDVRAPLYIVMGAVTLLLAIACANVANLQLSSAMARRREMSVRSALGAGRWRLARQLLTESVILSALGGLLGVAVAYAGVALLVSIIPIDLTFFSPIRVDGRVMAFAALVSILTGIVFGLAPAIHASRTNLNDALSTRTGGLSARIRGVEMRGVFVIAQLALSIVLLVGAGLLTRTLVKLQQVDLGFDTSNLLTMEFRLPATKYSQPQQVSDFFTRAIAEIRAVPGVRSAALVRAVPLSGNSDARAYAVAGAPEPDKGQAPVLQLNTVSPGYFKTIGLALVTGRDVNEHDDADAPPVVVVNETFARREWPNGSAIGQRIRFVDSDRWLTVVGVARDAKHFGPADQPTPQAYIPFMQMPQIFTSVVVRANRDAIALGPLVREAIWRVDRDQPVWKIRTMDSLVANTLGSKRVLLVLVGVFASVALLLAGVGIFGVMSFAVAQRTHEVGVRMALGASGGEVLRLIVGQGLRLTAFALLIGLAAAAGTTRLMASQLFGVTPSDPVTFALVPIVLCAVAALACYLPARRASRLDPLTALRRE